MKRILTLSVMIFLCTAGWSQLIPDSAIIDVNPIQETKNIIPSTYFYIDSSSSASIQDILLKKFSPLTGFKSRRSVPAGMIHYRYYLKFELQNSADTAAEVFLKPGSYIENILLHRIDSAGHLYTGTRRYAGYVKIVLAPHERSLFVVYLKPLKTENVSISPQLIKGSFLDNFKISLLYSRSDLKIFGYILSGVLLMMILFMTTSFRFSRKEEFLFNALYSLCMFLLIFFNSYVLRTSTPFANFFISYLDFFLLITGTIFYIAFTRKFLDTTIKYIFLDKFLQYAMIFLFFSLLIYTVLNFLTDLYHIQSLVENVVKFITLGIAVFFIILALRQRDPLLNYVAVGNAAMVIFSGISLGMILTDKRTVTLFNSSSFYYYLGIAFELIFFLLGLTYKNRKEIIERTKEQEALKLYAEKMDYETQIAIMKAQQDVRDRISSDMHDDLGAGMTTIRLYSELAKTRLGNNNIPEIDKISSSSDELLNKMNAIIWSMSSSNDSLGNMTAYIRSYALEYLEDTGIHCRIEIPDNLPNIEVSGEIRRNVFLVVKEALNNIVKYSKASEVMIKLVRVADGLTLYIQDNGIGINFNELRQFSNGLNNMKKRMMDVNIEFSIENKNGTLVTLHRKINNF